MGATFQLPETEVSFRYDPLSLSKDTSFIIYEKDFNFIKSLLLFFYSLRRTFYRTGGDGGA
jgi:hypothetical protein